MHVTLLVNNLFAQGTKKLHFTVELNYIQIRFNGVGTPRSRHV